MTNETIEGFRLSPQQERLWSQQNGQGGVFCAQSVFRVEGSIEQTLLREALESLCRRHEILRTIFQKLPNVSIPLQVISDNVVPLFAEHDLSQTPLAEQPARLAAYVKAAQDFDFDFERGPLLHCSLLTLSPDERILVLTVPALCADHVGLDNLARELVSCYDGLLGSAAPVDVDVQQYADLSEWQNEMLESEDAKFGAEYCERLNLTPARAVKLPFTDSPDPERPFAAAFYRLEIEPSRARVIATLAEQNSVSTSILLLACWQVLLWRLTSESEMILGIAHDGRKYEELAGALGLFARYLPLKSDLRSDLSFTDLLAQLTAAARDAESWQEYFVWPQLQSPTTDPASLSFFPFGFEYRKPVQTFDGSALRLSLQSQLACFERFHLKLSCVETGDLLTAEFHFDEDVISRDNVRRLSAQFQVLLESVCRNTDRTIGSFDVLSKAERMQLLFEFNETRSASLHDRAIHQLVEEQVERTPNAPAVVFEHEILSYQELNRCANQVAHRLREFGVGPQVLVGVCMERSLEMVVGLLAILKAGGAYVPLDPGYPQDRLSWMLADTQVPVLLTQEHLKTTLPPHAAQVITLDTDWDWIAQAGDQNVASGVTSENLAYVIYTSGSTGRPKGVMISHRAICNRLLWMQENFPLNVSDSVLQKTPYSFDASVWELFVPLLSGARLVIARPGGHQDSAYLVRTVIEHEITVLQLVPTMLHIFIEERDVEACTSLKRIFCGGEVLSLELQERFFSRLDAELHNLYGPTEVSIDATHWVCERRHSRKVIPIGRPIANTQIYLLDEQMQLVPFGVAGEVFVGGAGLGWGYLHRPELTSERFVPHPFSQTGGARLYRTGDLARYTAEGAIEYLGRIDHQVKLRGFRIELGEIEAGLNANTAVRESVVLAREDTPGDQRLVAYIVADLALAAGANSDYLSTGGAAKERTGRDVLVTELRLSLKRQLPDYMVPSVIVTLSSMPLLPNGKLDRRALPAPEQDLSETSAFFVAPRTKLEGDLCDLWAEVLGLKRVGIHDNFFELGGHSLLATQFVTRLSDELGINLPLRTLFDSPTVIDIAASLERDQPAGNGFVAQPINRVSREDSLPLSFAQQRLWFLDQLEPGTAYYNLTAAVRLTGRLDRQALERGLLELIKRHESLRTTFKVVDAEPRQVFSTALDFKLQKLDLRELKAQQQATEVERLASEEAQRPFDLEQGPLVRAALLQLDEDEHVFLLTMHHIIGDGWSTELFVREMAILYEAFAEGQGSPLPMLEIQYADYAVWQREWFAGEALATQLAYWKEQLSAVPAVLELATDRPRPAVQTFRGAHLSFRPGEAFSEELRLLSQREGVTLFMLLLAVFQTLLYRYTGQPDISVGTPIANRNHAGLDGLIGFFANTLVMRTNFAASARWDTPSSPSLRFNELLQRVREVTLGAYGHQDMPFERLVEELQPQRSLSYSPLFQVMFAMQGEALRSVKLKGLNLTPLLTESGVAKFDLTLFMHEEAGELIGTWEYNTDLFDQETIQRLSGHFLNLLAGVSANPDQRVAQLPLLSDEERRQLLVIWNDTRVEIDSTQSFAQLFEEQVRRKPQAVAVVCADESLTYQELNHRVDRLALHLVRQGVGPETLVGLLAARGTELLIAMVAVFKAGAAYLPLDPLWPSTRLAHVLKQSRVALVAITGEMREPLSRSFDELLDTARPQIVEIERVLEAGKVSGPLSTEEARKLESRSGPNNLAYVIYTSGSTGVPKGAMIDNRGMLNHLHAKVRDLALTERDVVAQTASQCFDISVWQFLAPLMVGAEVHIFQDEVAHDPANLLSQAEGGGLTILEVVPSMLRAMTEVWRTNGDELTSAVGATPPTALRWLLVTGEALPPKLCRQWLSRHPRVPMLNAYGPTECSDDVTHYVIDCPPAATTASVPIGRPIINTTIYVLDDSLLPLPRGVAGELYVGGAGVGRGYLYDSERTAISFVPDPFSSDAGARMYRSGDLARYLGDGQIEFLGRIDHQTKVRGFRIELGEIEACLRQHEALRDAVVVTSEDERAEKRLVAYAVIAEGKTAAGLTTELRAFLKERLPEYMVPSAFVLMDTLPLTANGKVDRAALPAPGQSLAGDASETGILPTPTEEIVSSVWQVVLGIERILLDENFFELGGHSLLATQVVSRLRQAFKIELPLRSIFEEPTVRGLARKLAGMQRAEVGEEMPPPIEPVLRQSLMPLSFAQMRLWFLDQMKPRDYTYNIPTYVRLQGPLDLAALERSANEIVRRHETLRTSFATVNGEPAQEIAEAMELELPVTDLSHVPEQERESHAQQLAQREARLPFTLSLAPLLRLRLLRMGEEEHLLLLTMHHIISDGWSLAILIRELGNLYSAALKGQQELPAVLEPLPIQYADYAVWQRRWLSGQRLAAAEKYWREQLRGAPPVLELPADFSRPPIQTTRGADFPLDLGNDLFAGLKLFSRRESVTLFMTLLAAFQTLLHYYTERADLVLGTDVANRDRVETEGLIGFFINQLALRTDLSGNPSFRELLQRVREVTLEAYGHQDLPFDKVVEVLNPERRLENSSVFQVKIIHQNVLAQNQELEGLVITPLEFDSQVAKHDLILILSESADTLTGLLNYNTDLFKPSTIERMAAQFTALLRTVIMKPEWRLGELEAMLTEIEKERQAQEARRLGAANLKKFKSIKNKISTVASKNPVRIGTLSGSGPLPLLFEPEVDEVDLVEWAGRNQPLLQTKLLEHGALLFRGFQPSSSPDFERFAQKFCPELFNENGEHPRRAVSGNVYTPVFYPPDKPLLWHNENSFNCRWPMKIWFGCLQPAAQGGETPLVDSRKVFDLVDPGIRARFQEKKIMYVRNYGDGLGLDWQTVLQVSDRAGAEEHCRRFQMEWEWKSGNRLRTRSVRAAVLPHPKTGEWLWFNQAQHWHVACLDPITRESLLSLFAEEDLPRHCYYGDGSPIEDSIMEEICGVYRQLEVSFAWRAGDILMLDNMLTAHARNPFEGVRSLLVTMGEMVNEKEFQDA